MTTKKPISWDIRIAISPEDGDEARKEECTALMGVISKLAIQVVKLKLIELGYPENDDSGVTTSRGTITVNNKETADKILDTISDINTSDLKLINDPDIKHLIDRAAERFAISRLQILDVVVQLFNEARAFFESSTLVTTSPPSVELKGVTKSQGYWIIGELKKIMLKKCGDNIITGTDGKPIQA